MIVRWDYCPTSTDDMSVCRHVQVSNADALAFYERFGFHIIERKENYYKRIEPADAFVLQKSLKPTPDTDTPADADRPTDTATAAVESSDAASVVLTESETVTTTSE